jgi:hypothetical protein
MTVPDDQEQKWLRKLLPELNQLPDDWKIVIRHEEDKDKKDKNGKKRYYKRISYLKGETETYNHPQCGPLPHGWQIRVVRNSLTGKAEPRYVNSKNEKTYLIDPRVRSEVLKAHGEQVRKGHVKADPANKAIFLIAGSVRKTKKGEKLSDLKRAPIGTTDISHHYEYLYAIDGGPDGGIGGMNGGVFVVRLKASGVLYVEKRYLIIYCMPRRMQMAY